MVRTIAKDLAANVIIVNGVAPGPTATDLFLQGKSEVLLEKIKQSSPFRRRGQPEDIANVGVLLFGKDSAWAAR